MCGPGWQLREEVSDVMDEDERNPSTGSTFAKSHRVGMEREAEAGKC